jgi:UDP-N-acetylglucosamine 2-epimerase (non-hydrolysing)
MPRIKVDLISAARPNFMKIAPLYRALVRETGWCQQRLVHTGQHYDVNMSTAFFRDFGLPNPDLHLGVGSGTHAEQTAGVMLAYEKACRENPPDWVIVVGDVNSTIACALAATKLGIKVAHLEAGLRSGDRSMPEEINRIVTDSLSDLLWTPSEDADGNLRREGISDTRIERVGNIMIDSLEMMRPTIERNDRAATLGLVAGRYGVVTLHRPSNVDDGETLTGIVEALITVGSSIPIVFPVHPRTQGRLQSFGLLRRLKSSAGVHILDPLGYIDFMGLVFRSAFVLTDSGGIQEETTYLGIPCLTLRENTERPVTVTLGTNRLVKAHEVGNALAMVIEGKWPQGHVPPLWDGQTAARVVASLQARLNSSKQEARYSQ